MAEDLKVVGAYATPMEAAMARNRLEAAGVRAFLADDHSIGWLWHLGTALKGVKLLVAERDLMRASEILESVEQPPTADKPSQSWSCPKCGADVDGALEVCWACGTTAQGTEDPDFQDADSLVLATPRKGPAEKGPPSPLLAMVLVLFIAPVATVLSVQALTGILGVELSAIFAGSAAFQVLIWLLIACEFLALIGIFQSYYYTPPPPEEPAEALAETPAGGEPAPEDEWGVDAVELARTARWACVAAVLGIAFFPPLLNIYSMWLIVRHELYRRGIGQRWGWMIYVAIVLNVMVFSVILLLFLLSGGLHGRIS